MISLSYPFWFVSFCFLSGIAYAGAMYYRDQRFQEMTARLNKILGTLRFLAVSILCFLLLSPVIKSKTVEVRKPVVVIAQDESESVNLAFSKDDTARYKAAVTELREALAEQYDVKLLGFGSAVRENANFRYTDKTTNISSAIDYVYDLYSNQNLGALILATDGIYNEGSSPLYNSAKLGVPLYAVALGDTTPRKDLYIKKVYNNRIAYLGDKFTVEVDIAAFNCQGAGSKLSVSKVSGNNASQTIQEIPFSVDRHDYFGTQKLLIEATEAGVLHYRLSLSAVAGEASTVNNVKDIYIEVLDARQKILLLANAPHPDIAAIRTVIDNNKNYQCEVAYVNSLQGGVAKYDFVILHQVPGTMGTGDAVINELKAKRIPHLFVLGAQTNINTFNAQQAVLRLSGNIAQTNTVEARLASGFSLFTLSDKFLSVVNTFPPLVAPFGEFIPSPGTTVLFKQKIGSVETAYPLLLFGEQQGLKVGVLAAEGIYKWRIFDYMMRKNFELADEIVSKTINYLSVKEDKRRFRVYTSETVFDENEAITFDAELYNQSYQLVNEPDAFMTISDASGKQFKYTFAKNSRTYSLNCGFLPVGEYSYSATTSFNSENFKAEGKFTIQPIQQEFFATTADHNLLRTLAGRYGGEVVNWQNMKQLAETLNNAKKIPALRYESTTTHSLINLWWIFFLIVALLSTEWFLRRYYGSY